MGEDLIGYAPMEDETEEWDECEEVLCDYWEVNEAVSNKDPIEQHIASYIYHDKRYDVDGTYCVSCQPLRLPFTYEDDCHCTAYEHFVQPWRCIPCVLAEEAKSVTLGPKMQYIYDPKNILNSAARCDDGMIRVSVINVLPWGAAR